MRLNGAFGPVVSTEVSVAMRLNGAFGPVVSTEVSVTMRLGPLLDFAISGQKSKRMAIRTLVELRAPVASAGAERLPPTKLVIPLNHIGQG